MTLLATETNDDIRSTQKIEDYKSCQIWLEGYNSPSTKKAYKIHLSLFCKYHNTDPDSLVQLKVEQIKTMVINYIIHLKKVAKQSSGEARTWELTVNSVKVCLTNVEREYECLIVLKHPGKLAYLSEIDIEKMGVKKLGDEKYEQTAN
jgi:predicted metal-binding protein